MKKIFYFTFVISAGMLASCGKKPNNNNNTGPSNTGTTLQKIQDSVYLYAHEDYLWFNQLPSYGTFNPAHSPIRAI